MAISSNSSSPSPDSTWLPGTSQAFLELEYHALSSASLPGEHMFLLLDVACAFPSLLHVYVFEDMNGAYAPAWLLSALKSLCEQLSGRFTFGAG